MPHFVFHVGPHKTGSTYLQDLFFDHREALNRHGILYPAQWLGPHTGHHLLADTIKRRLTDSLTANFAELMTHDGTVLLSSEDMADLTADDWAIVRLLLSNNATTFVFYCRRWSELIPSCWQEEVKQGSIETFPEFYAPRISNPFNNNIINYSITLDNIAKAFDQSAIALISYNNLAENNVDLFSHFVNSVLRLKEFPHPNSRSSNRSLGIREVELIRALNVLHQLNTGSSRPRILDNFLLVRPKLDLDSLFAAMSTSRVRMIIDDSAPALNDLFLYISSRYGANLVEQGHGRDIFTRVREKHVSYIGGNYLLTSGIVDRLKEIYDEVQKLNPSSSTARFVSAM
jgi:hypothetical protein